MVEPQDVDESLQEEIQDECSKYVLKDNDWSKWTVQNKMSPNIKTLYLFLW